MSGLARGLTLKLRVVCMPIGAESIFIASSLNVSIDSLRAPNRIGWADSGEHDWRGAVLLAVKLQ